MKLHCNIQSALHIDISNHSSHHKGPAKLERAHISALARVAKRREDVCFYMTGLKAKRCEKMAEIRQRGRRW